MFTSKKALLSFIPFFGNAILLMIFGKKLNQYSSIPKLDFQLKGYNINFVFSLFSEYELKGRNLYYYLTLLDIPFPFFVAIFGYFYFGSTWKKWNLKFIWKILFTACLSFLVFDCIENYFVIRMLNNFPILNEKEILLSSFATQIKLISLIIIYSFIPITLIIQLSKLLKKKSYV